MNLGSQGYDPYGLTIIKASLDQGGMQELTETNEALMFVDGGYSYPEIFCFGFDAIDGRPNQSYK